MMGVILEKKYFCMQHRKKGSGSKENVGRKSLTYKTKRIHKVVPLEVYDLCMSLIDAEILKFKSKMNN